MRAPTQKGSVLYWLIFTLAFASVWLGADSLAGTPSPANLAAAPVVTDYSMLRATGCTAGETVRVTDAGISGDFRCSGSDPHAPDGDDGGIVISAENGNWWVRQFAHSVAEPIRLDWFQVNDNEDITPLLRDLAIDYAPKLYVKVPDRELTLRIDWVNLSGTTEYFYLLESGFDVTIKHVSNPTSANDAEMFVISNYREVVIGSPFDKGDRNAYHLTFESNAVGPLASSWTKSIDNALFRLSCRWDNCSRLVFRANVKYPRMAGIAHFGDGRPSSRRVDSAYVSGVHESSSLVFNSGIKWLELEDPLITDPWGQGVGWDGTAYDGLNNDPAKMTKSRGVWFQQLDRIVGSMELQYGWSHYFYANVEYIGESASNPLVVKAKDLGYSIDGTEMSSSGIGTQAGKADPSGDHGPNKKFIRYDESNQIYGIARAWSGAWLESTSQDTYGNCLGFQTNYNYIRYVNALRDGGIKRLDCGLDELANNYFSGNHLPNYSPTLTVWDRSTVHDYRGHNVQIPFNADPDVARGATGVHIGPSVSLSGSLIVMAGSDVVVDGLRFSNNPRRVIWIDNGSNSAHVTVRLSNVDAPGSRIEAANASRATIIVDGTTVSLPYTFGSSPSTGEEIQDISVSDGWNAVSLNVIPVDQSVESVTQSLGSSLVLVKNGAGEIYYPELGINGIGDWSHYEGYQMNLTSPSLLSVRGPVIEPSATAISVKAGWNMIPFLPQTPVTVESAFSSIAEVLVMVKDNDGLIYYPELGIDTIGEARPGLGYSLYARADGVLVYP